MKKEIKHYQVRFYPNGKFKVVETKEFHPSQMDYISSSFNTKTKEKYDYIIAKEGEIDKAKKKIAKYLIKEVKKKRDEYEKKLVTLNYFKEPEKEKDYELQEKILEIIERNQDTYIGINEANLHASFEIAEMILKKEVNNGNICNG